MKTSLNSKRCIFASTLFVSLGIVIGAAAQEPSIKDLLMRSPTPVKELEARFDSASLPELKGYLDDQSMARHWNNVILAIGLVGGEDGVDFLISYLETRFKGEVNSHESAALSYVPPALGTQAKKGSRKALEYLINHHRPSQWEDSPVDWRTRTKSGEVLQRSLCNRVWLGLLVADDPEAHEVLVKLATDPDPEYAELRRTSSMARDMAKTLEALAAERSQAEPGGRQPGDPLTKASPSPDPAQTVKESTAGTDMETTELTQKAIAEFRRISEACLKNGVESVAGMLADNGRPLVKNGRTSKGDVTTMVRYLKETGEWEMTKAILADVVGPDSEPLNFGKASVVERSDGTILATIPLVGSEAVRLRHAAVIPGSSTLTVGPEGRLRVLMLKVGDQWYWNPFGW